MDESESSFHHVQRLSQSAVELSLIDFDENAGSISAALPSDSHGHVLAELSSTPSPSVGAASTMMSQQQSPANARKPSPIRAFLTPPLLRKRKQQQPINSSSKLLDDHGNSTARLFGSSVLSTGSSHRAKSFGFLSLLKAKFADRSGRFKHQQQPVVQSSVPEGTETTYSRNEEVSDLPYDGNTLTSFVEERDQCADHVQEGEEAASDGNLQLWASAGLSAAAATAASSVMPRLAVPKKVSSSIIGPKRTCFYSSHQVINSTTTLLAAGSLAVAPITSVQQGSMPPVGPFRLHVVLKQGRELAAKDSCGTSDPYVKFKLGSKIVHRSKTVYKDLNPVWDEEFDSHLDDLATPLHIRVYDYDLIGQDDFLGSCNLDLTPLELNKVNFYTLDLFSDEADGRQGIIDLSVGLYPKSADDDSDHKGGKVGDQAKKMKVQIWSSIVNVLVIEGKQLKDKEGDPLSKPYLRIKLSGEKYKTKSVTRNSCSTSVTWLEQFDFHLYEDQSHLLEISLYEKSSLGWEESIARAVLDLASVEGERTHSINCEFQQGGSGTLSLLVTISGTTANETISDLSTQQPAAADSKEMENIKKRYSLLRSLYNIRDVGHLSVKVFRATGLASADIGGKSDPFCVLQLVNSRLQTQTEYKTLNPSWNKIFTFNVKDINSVLEVTVYDEDRDHRFEFLGTVYIPLLRIVNGQKKWYALKDRKLRSRAKGSNPQILMELSVFWNQIRATIQTLQPKEKKYIEPELKFSRQKFVRNVMRIKSVALEMVEVGKVIESCFEWESTLRSSIAFAVFLLGTWHFEPYLIPLGLLLAFVRHFVVRIFTTTNINEYDSEQVSNDDDDDDDDKNKGENKTFKERLQVIQEATLTVQNSIGFIVSMMESVKNTFNFTVPFLSYMAIILLMIGSVVLYAVPLRYLILAWGINKFTRKLLRPHSIPNNEAVDFLSRVPDDEQLIDYREFMAREMRSEPSVETEVKTKKNPKKK